MTTITATDRMAEVRRRLPDARQAMIAALGTIPAAGGSGGSSGPSDRTGRLACAYLANPDIDPARRDLDTLTMILWRARARRHFTNGEIAAMLDLCDRWAPTPQRRNAIEERLRSAAEGKGDDGCVSCSRIKDHRGHPIYSEQHPGLKVCKSCNDMLNRVRAHDRYVNAELVPLPVMQWRQRHAGKQVSPSILERLLSGHDA